MQPRRNKRCHWQRQVGKRMEGAGVKQNKVGLACDSMHHEHQHNAYRQPCSTKKGVRLMKREQQRVARWSTVTTRGTQVDLGGQSLRLRLHTPNGRTSAVCTSPLSDDALCALAIGINSGAATRHSGPGCHLKVLVEFSLQVWQYKRESWCNCLLLRQAAHIATGSSYVSTLTICGNGAFSADAEAFGSAAAAQI